MSARPAPIGAAVQRLAPAAIAARVARDIPDGYCVNLGVGIPTQVANVPTPGREIMFHCENGILGAGPAAVGDAVDSDLINSGKVPITIVPGGAYINHADSFALIRNGRLDLALLGAFEVSASGDLANWTVSSDAVPAVGGAMDLAVGAREVWVLMNLFTSAGKSKLVAECGYPLTAAGVVRRVYSDHATFVLTPAGACVTELAPGLTLDELRVRVDVPLVGGSEPERTEVRTAVGTHRG